MAHLDLHCLYRYSLRSTGLKGLILKPSERTGPLGHVVLNNGDPKQQVYSQSLSSIRSSTVSRITVKLQWPELLLHHGNLSQIRVVQVTEG